MMAGTYMKIFIHENRRDGERMSNNYMAQVQKAEFDAEQERKRRSLMASSFNEAANHLDWPKLDLGPVPQIDPITGRPIPNETYVPPEPRTGAERTRKADKVSDPVNKRAHSHYFKDVSSLTEVDVYAVCDLFQVNDCSGATQHAIKKLLLPGQRGAGKDAMKDLQEAVDTLTRKLQMMKAAA